MAKICPNCNRENPTNATYCMQCNTLLVEEENLREEDRLRRDVANSKEVSTVLQSNNKELMAKVQTVSLEIEGYNHKIKELTSQANATTEKLSMAKTEWEQREKHIKSLVANEIAMKRGIRNKLLITLLLFAVSVFITGVISVNRASNAQELRDQNEKEIGNLNDSITKLFGQCDSLVICCDQLNDCIARRKRKIKVGTTRKIVNGPCKFNAYNISQGIISISFTYPGGLSKSYQYYYDEKYDL